MAKYSVGGTQVIDDNGKIDWGRIANPVLYYGIQSLNVSYTNCATYGDITVTKNAATGSVTITVTASGGAAYNCVCDCACACACATC